MKHRKVLTINQGMFYLGYSTCHCQSNKPFLKFLVFDILLWVSEGKSFREAFQSILPERIQRVSKAKTDKPQTDVTLQDNDT